MATMVTRRKFLGGGAVAVGGAAAALSPSVALAGPRKRAAYALDPCAGGCESCNACESHAAAMVFARKQDIRRAHLGCDCGVVETALPFGTWVALYGHPEHMRAGEADRRDRRVAAILKTKL